ncbi:hypothetical protein H9635_08155 [Solibacillus sp. A46]|uniref:Uncharacterized protein n=1 Tax=Solibacillus faecavium TaxID=2762221 RepID=A0ABR8XXN5_9BACL|nr:hypothetical protein [Solibacillus faecavium]MBD8036712.1 hypothetical protein [Solibacillus faecavium]
MLKVFFSVLSAFLFLVISSSFTQMPFHFERKIFDLIIGPTLYLPFGLGIIGIIFAMFGVKGYVRLTLVGLNIFGLIGYLVIFIMATIGFLDP